MPKVPVLELLYEALRSELGIIVATSDPTALKQKLYAARREADDPQLDSLSFVTSRTNPDREIWIVRKPDDKSEPTETYSPSSEG